VAACATAAMRDEGYETLRVHSLKFLPATGFDLYHCTFGGGLTFVLHTAGAATPLLHATPGLYFFFTFFGKSLGNCSIFLFPSFCVPAMVYCAVVMRGDFNDGEKRML
jgi:hypothetical protein